MRLGAVNAISAQYLGYIGDIWNTGRDAAQVELKNERVGSAYGKQGEKKTQATVVVICKDKNLLY